MKYFKLFIIIILGMFPVLVCGKPDTYDRTKEEIGVPDDVVVDSKNLDDILKTPLINPDDRVYDFAELYSEEEERKLYASLRAFTDTTHLDLIILTIDDLDGYSISDYSNNFYDYNEFRDDGISFLIYKGEKEPEIYIGNHGKRDNKVFSIYTDERLNEILSYIYPTIHSSKYYKGSDDCIRVLLDYYQTDVKGKYEINEEGEVVRRIDWISIIIFSCSMTFIIVFIILRLMRKTYIVPRDNIQGKVNKYSLRIKLVHDKLVDTHYSKEK